VLNWNELVTAITSDSEGLFLKPVRDISYLGYFAALVWMENVLTVLSGSVSGTQLLFFFSNVEEKASNTLSVSALRQPIPLNR